MWLEGMGHRKAQLRKPGVSSARQEVLSGSRQTLACVELTTGCALFPSTVQPPLEIHGQGWTLVPFQVRLLGQSSARHSVCAWLNRQGTGWHAGATENEEAPVPDATEIA